jgi:hypothetical protein
MPTINKLIGFDDSSDTYTFYRERISDGVLFPYDTTQGVEFVPWSNGTVEIPDNLVSADSHKENYPDGSGHSFAEIVKSKQIKMTNRELWNSKMTTYLVKLPYQYARLVIPSNNVQGFQVPSFKQGEWQVRQFQVQGTMETIDQIKYAPWDANTTWPAEAIAQMDDDINSAVEETKRIVIADSYQTWDALTSAAELSKALKLFTRLLKGAVNPVRSFARLVSESREPKKVAGRWLEYRYGIMPTILEIQDLMKLITEVGFAYKTSRSTRTGSLTLPTDAPDDANGVNITERQHDWRVSATGKARYGTSSLRALDQISVNPFLTGWELIPFSFVVDWFVNIGDYIQAQTLSLMDHSEQRMFCVSIKKVDSWRQYHRRRYTAYGNLPTYDTVGNAYYMQNILSDHSDHLLRDWKREHYTRRIFYPSDAVLSFKPNLNWQRFLDSIALSTRSTSKSFGNLRL